MKKIFAFLSAILAIITISSCELTKNDGDSQTDMLLMLAMPSTELQGSWLSACMDTTTMESMQVFGSQSMQFRNTYAASKVTTTTYYYTDTACTGDPIGTGVSRTSFKLEGEIYIDATYAKKMKTQFSASGKVYTPLTTEAVTHANTNSGFNQTGWVLNVSKSISPLIGYDGTNSTSTIQSFFNAGWDGWSRSYYILAFTQIQFSTYFDAAYVFSTNEYPENLGSVFLTYDKQ